MTKIIVRSWPLLTLLAGLTVAGCATGTSGAERGTLSPMQRAAMQTKELSGDLDTAYKATISVLQDRGWQIDAVDRDSGLIQASSIRYQDVIGPDDDFRTQEDIIQKTRAKMSAFKGNKEVSPALWTRWERLTVLVEPWGKGSVQVRMTIVKCGSLPGGLHYYPYPKAFGYKDDQVQETAKERSVIVDNPQVYQLLFQEIQKAIFVRQGLTGK